MCVCVWGGGGDGNESCVCFIIMRVLHGGGGGLRECCMGGWGGLGGLRECCVWVCFMAMRVVFHGKNNVGCVLW